MAHIWVQGGPRIDFGRFEDAFWVDFGSVFDAKTVVLTTGTFLGGRIWIGNQSMSAGRAGEQASEGLTEELQKLGFTTDRLKTGTPARVDRRSIDFDSLEDNMVTIRERDSMAQTRILISELPEIISKKL